MISLYHEQLAAHYEKYPYPSYPWWMMGRWSDLDSVDFKTWGISHECKRAWIVGCGTIAPQMFGRRNPEVEILASDLSTAALKKARFRLWLHGIRNVKLLQEDLLETGYQEVFDAIDCYGVLHHCFSPAMGLKKLASALRSGGVLRLMLYSKEARSQIESLRAEVFSQKMKSVTQIKKWLNEKNIENESEFRSRSGIADALLNPIVQTYDKAAIEALLHLEPSLRLLKWEQPGNYLLFLQKS